MSDPTILTTVTAEATSASKHSILSRLTSKMPSLLWVLVVGLIMAVIFLYMWHRGDRLALLQIKRAQMQCVRAQDCASMIEESITEYDRIRQRIQEAHVTKTMLQPLKQEEQEEQEESSSEEEQDDMSIDEEEEEEPSSEEEEEEEEEDEYTRAMSSDDSDGATLAAPPPTDSSSSS